MRYSKYKIQDKKDEGPRLHAAWRGIGCLLFIILPVVAYALASNLVDSGLIQRYISIPRNLLQPMPLDFVGLDPLPNFYASLVVGMAITVVLYAGVFVIYSFLYRIIGPPKYGPTDVPPVRPRGRRPRKSR
jgi:hypothetical protein